MQSHSCHIAKHFIFDIMNISKEMHIYVIYIYYINFFRETPEYIQFKCITFHVTHL
jgi:ABC-type amino acid transport system permease subunit